MAKKCGKCDKIVYPAEELKCLDKTWHKLCFKCTECGMQLTLKNHRGFNKFPYCNAHSPQIKATPVAETLEQKRLKEMTGLNSQVKYQKEYRENIGNVTSIADDPTTQRVKGLANLNPSKYAESRNDGASYTRPSRSNEEYEEDYDEQTQQLSGGGGGGGDEGLCYKANYDYEAADTDEVSISAGDTIIQCEVIDDGWISGTVERTGERGLIPATYVEQI